MSMQPVNPFIDFASLQVEQFSSYSEQLEAYLKRQVSKIEENMDNHINSLKLVEDKVDTSRLFEMHYEDQYHSFNNEFPIILRTSLFLSTYTFLEKTLNKLCKDYEEDNNVKLKDIRHNGITKSKFYLTNVCNIEFPDKDWHLILQYNVIRNSLAHDGYSLLISNPKFEKLSGTEQKLKNAVEEVVGATIIDKGGFYQVSFNESFCDVFLSIIYKFISDLSESIKK